ncbi:MerR family transcriptional regulator [Streptomyces sodiiphilus]|uniref:MerR family transcriptional regulator n=1 Tax=Streptomyces sodiiphilus TaxID=226217 RepID=A0ABP5B7T0_9ACTN
MTGNGESGAVGGVSALPGAPQRPGLRHTVARQNRGTPEKLGYRGPSACAAAGITYRQLDYWARTGLVEPSVRPAHGSGTQRLYSFRDILVLKIVKRLLDAGVSLQSIRTAVRALRSGELAELADLTLMSDGAAVYRCDSPDDLAELLRGGRGVFGIAVGAVWADVQSALAQLQAERVDTGESVLRDHPGDELARRRHRPG